MFAYPCKVFITSMILKQDYAINNKLTKKDIVMDNHQAIARLLSNITKDNQTLATIQNAIESGNQNFDDEFVTAWNERVESCKSGIKALNDKSGYIKCFYNRAYLVLNVLNDDVICVIK